MDGYFVADVDEFWGVCEEGEVGGVGVGSYDDTPEYECIHDVLDLVEAEDVERPLFGPGRVLVDVVSDLLLEDQVGLVRTSQEVLVKRELIPVLSILQVHLIVRVVVLDARELRPGSLRYRLQLLHSPQTLPYLHPQIVWDT